MSTRNDTRRPRWLAPLVAALAVLLAGGYGTYAFWTASDEIDPAALISGHLDSTLGTAQWHDISADVPGQPVSFDPATFRVTPGDTIEMRQPVTITGSGDHLGATLAVTVPAATSNPWADQLAVAFEILDPSDSAITSEPLAAGDTSTPVAVTIGQTYTLRITFTLPDTVPDTVDANPIATFTPIDVLVKQVHA